MLRTTALLAAVLGLALAAAGSGSAAGRASSASILIQHQVAHCHAWSVNGGPFAAHHSISLARGATLKFTNDDVMPHRLVEVSGPRHLSMRNGTTMPMGKGMHRASGPGTMNSMGATTTVRLTAPGTYKFTTKAGEDYMAGVQTTGEDNVLTLTVVVS